MTKRFISFDNKKHKYFEFSNYYPFNFELNIKNNYTKKNELIKFHSIIQYYYSEKFNANNKTSQKYRNYILKTDSPKKCFLLGKLRKFMFNWPINSKSKITIYDLVDKYKDKVQKRFNWKNIRIKILLKGLRIKFNNNKLKELLLSTGDKPIVENTTGVWSFKNNLLGNCLMIIRNELTSN